MIIPSGHQHNSTRRVVCSRCLPVDYDPEQWGDIYSWTVDLRSGDPSLACEACGTVIVAAPPPADEGV